MSHLIHSARIFQSSADVHVNQMWTRATKTIESGQQTIFLISSTEFNNRHSYLIVVFNLEVASLNDYTIHNVGNSDSLISGWVKYDFLLKLLQFIYMLLDLYPFEIHICLFLIILIYFQLAMSAPMVRNKTQQKIMSSL